MVTPRERGVTGSDTATSSETTRVAAQEPSISRHVRNRMIPGAGIPGNGRVHIKENTRDEIQANTLQRLRRAGADRIGDDAGRDGSAFRSCLLYTSPSPRDRTRSRMPS